MMGEIAFGGIFVPTLLLLAVFAAALTVLLSRLLSRVGAYRFVAYHALVDLCFFILILGALNMALPLLDIHQ